MPEAVEMQLGDVSGAVVSVFESRRPCFLAVVCTQTPRQNEPATAGWGETTRSSARCQLSVVSSTPSHGGWGLAHCEEGVAFPLFLR